LGSTGSQKEGKAKVDLERTVLEEAGNCGKTWSEVKRLVDNRVRWRCSTNALRSKGKEIIYYYQYCFCCCC